jgi:aspartate/methionine/tyrosine aminotransferase
MKNEKRKMRNEIGKVYFEPYPFEKLSMLLDGIEPNGDYAPLSMTIGEPQFDTPEFILNELTKNAYLLNKYPKTAGEDFLRAGMLTYLDKRFGLQLDTAQIIPTFGTRELLFNFPQFLLEGTENPTMAYPNTFYQIYEGAAKVSQADIVYLDLNEENDFLPLVEKEKLSRCQLVILNSPDNPTASVMSLDAMKSWVRLALEYDFILLNDECYVDLYLDKPIPSLLNASIEAGNPTFKNILVANSVSKRSSAPGLRSGFVAGDEDILSRYMTYRTYVGCASPLPLQHAAAAAWSDQEHVEVFRAKYRRNFELAKEILGVNPPQATFYIWLKVDDELEFTKELYRQYNVKVLPGSLLGRNGEGKGYVRLALVYDEDMMRDGLERIAAFGLDVDHLASPDNSAK